MAYDPLPILRKTPTPDPGQAPVRVRILDRTREQGTDARDFEGGGTVSHVEVQTARVYFVPGERRFLTKAAAYRRAAKALIRARYHEFGNHSHDAYALPWWESELEEKYEQALVERLARFLRYRDAIEAVGL